MNALMSTQLKKIPSNIWVVHVGSNSFPGISYPGKPQVVSRYILSNLWYQWWYNLFCYNRKLRAENVYEINLRSPRMTGWSGPVCLTGNWTPGFPGSGTRSGGSWAGLNPSTWVGWVTHSDTWQPSPFVRYPFSYNKIPSVAAFYKCSSFFSIEQNGLAYK